MDIKLNRSALLEGAGEEVVIEGVDEAVAVVVGLGTSHLEEGREKVVVEGVDEAVVVVVGTLETTTTRSS